MRSAGLGSLSYEAHPTLAVSPVREPLGVLEAWMWARAPKDADGTRPGGKEREHWPKGYARVAEFAGEMPETRLVYIGDRESGMRELMVRARCLDATLLFDPDDLRAAYILARKAPPKQPPALDTTIRLIAGLGSCLGR